MKKPCPDCDGDGFIDNGHVFVNCETCDGNGEVDAGKEKRSPRKTG